MGLVEALAFENGTEEPASIKFLE
ncbi:hypothetical protein CCACVL1_18201, partial [Corchorus capsularis]